MAWLLLAFTAGAQAIEVSPAELENRRCLNCHGQNSIAQYSAQERSQMVAPDGGPADSTPTKRPGLLVRPESLAQSVHAKLACVSCHTEAKTLPHPQLLGRVTCDSADCHAKAGAEFRRSSHAQALVRHDPQAPTCVSCHGGHQILPKTDRRSTVFPLNVVKICADCHQKHSTAQPNGSNPQQEVQAYLDSVHGRAVSVAGLVVAATCVDCHRGHDVLPSSDPQSSVYRVQVPKTCGRCHLGVEEVFDKSIHGRKLAEGDPKAPVCSDCHTAHQITQAGTPQFVRDLVAECGKCHDQPPRGAGKGARSLYQTYRMSYHGQVTGLGSIRGARCSDCHGAHDILPVSDPDSRLNPSHRAAACAKCHRDASASFAQFQPHADFHDSKRFPLLHAVWLYFMLAMGGTFSFFGVHTVFWFVRSALHRLRHGRHIKPDPKSPAIKRFTRVDRINHGLIIVSFFGLTLTGMPLLFSDHGWAHTLAQMLGGIHAAGILHRFFAVMLIANVVIHGVGVIRRIRRHSVSKVLFGPNSLLPRWKDVKDLFGMFRWFLTGKRPPAFDHWTYWEKFDYWAEVFGTGVIGFTGLTLWFPIFFAQYLPGWWFNIALIVHGYEALLAVGFIFTIHFFNAHLRPEKFPVDDVMFTGRISEAELKHERPEEYQRLVANGQLAALRMAPPPRWYRIFAITLGVSAMLVGTAMVLLIVLAGLGVI